MATNRHTTDRFYEMRQRTGTRTRAELIAHAAEAGLARPAPGASPADPTAGTGQSGGPTQRHDAGKQTIPKHVIPPRCDSNPATFPRFR
jgi:hypothetical protein